MKEKMTDVLTASSAESRAPETHAGAMFFCDILAERVAAEHSPRVLVVGSGAGHEAVAIARRLNAMVDAVDVEDFTLAEYREETRFQFRTASACELPYEDESFDVVFYHHVIEHVDDPPRSVVEIARVLRPGGWLFIGTPNRHRLVSSVGAHRQSEWEATLGNKLWDNARDWKDRLRGRFRNECGAHAGFTRAELDRMLANHFGQRQWLTREYLRYKYAAHRWSRCVKVATGRPLCWFAAPSIYVLCRKSAQTPREGG